MTFHTIFIQILVYLHLYVLKERVATQHTPKCVENRFDREVSYTLFIYLTFTRFSVTSVITLKIAFFLNCRLIIM